MKKLLIIFGLALPLLLTTAHAAPPGQTEKALDGFFSKYSGRKGYTTMELTGDLLKAAYGKPGSKVSGDMLKGVDRMRIVKAETGTVEFSADVNSLPSKTDLKLMSNVSENGKQVRTYYRPASPAIGGGNKRDAEFLMFMIGPNDNILIHMTGDFDIKNVSRFSGFGM